jgi:hypothetical protein
MARPHKETVPAPPPGAPHPHKGTAPAPETAEYAKQPAPPHGKRPAASTAVSQQ